MWFEVKNSRCVDPHVNSEPTHRHLYTDNVTKFLSVSDAILGVMEDLGQPNTSGENCHQAIYENDPIEVPDHDDRTSCHG